MKAVGIIRQVDNIGRVVIPAEIRQHNKWKPGTRIEMFATDGGLFLQEYQMDEGKQSAMDWLERAFTQAKSEADQAAIETAMKYLLKG